MRVIGAIAAGLATWIVVATLLNLALRYTWPAYAAVEQAMTFSRGMMAARLIIGAVSSLFAGFVGAWLARGKPLAAWSLVVVLLAIFVPLHYQLWQRFPAWYHVVFLLSLVVVTPLGALRRQR
ncbi:MAG TPA: hypothetical protein VFJ70_02630 [Burkholderiales bacterium]|nr:hypothetical protein [Burkholderiales bacterium]